MTKGSQARALDGNELYANRNTSRFSLTYLLMNTFQMLQLMEQIVLAHFKDYHSIRA